MLRRIMTNMKGLQLLVFLLGFSPFLHAQIAAPNLICISNDTLTWETPVNTCGTFVGYEIYASENPGGPYTLLTTITNQNQTRYFHAGVNGAVWYYYMQSNVDCPGQAILRSDTLDNLIPEPGPLRFVTVNGNSVEISWTPSPSPEVIAYVISRNTLSGTTILDTVYTGANLFYTDNMASPSTEIETYFAVAIDACGNQSLVTPPHNTILLEASAGNGCDARITLSWNAYQNWTGGVAAYEIWVGINGQAPILAAEVPGSAGTYNYENVNDRDTYCFFVRARQTGTAVTSNSNTVCLTPSVVQAVRNLLMENVSYTPDGLLEWQWSWNTTAAIASASIQLATTAGGSFGDLETIPVSPVLIPTNTLISADSPEVPDYYRIQAVDSCGRVVFSNPARPPRLLGTAGEGNLNNLFWAAYTNDSASVFAYELYRDEGNGAFLLTTLSGNTLEYADAIDFSDNEQGTHCYFVVAVASLRLSDGSTKMVRSRSNTVCLEQIPNLFIPNVFAPEGINRTFHPFLQFGDPAEYQMLIFDRWGGQVFVSNTLSLGWDGKKDGKPMPQGVYVYYIRLKQNSGVVIERKGSVMLLR